MSRPPAGASDLERRLDAAAEDRLGRAPVGLAAALWNPDRAPREWLPRLAAIFRVPAFSADWTELDQRRAIRESLTTGLRAAGTQAGAEAILGLAGAVYDYREPDAAFTVEIDILNADALTLPAAEINRILQSRKRAAVKLTVSQVAGGELEVPVRGGLGAAVVAPALEGEL